MTTSVDTDGGAHFNRPVSTDGGDVVGRDQIKINLIGDVNTDQIESVLPDLRALLSRRDTEVYAEPGQDRLRLTNPNGDHVLLSDKAAAALLPAAVRQADPDAYLGALLVHPRYRPWARRYVPLAGASTETRTPAGWSDVAPEYTALETSGEGGQRRIQRVRLSDITEAVARHDAWVLLGEPGSGKTTTLFRLLIDLARERLQTGDGRLPLLLPLAEYKGYASPYEFVMAVWRRRVGTDDVEARLRAGDLFMLADGLNEMPFADSTDYRAQVGAWRRFADEWLGNRLVFTCRSRDYGESLGLAQVEIEPLDDTRVRDFLDRYLSPELAVSAWERLDGSTLLALMRNPFYLWILCWLIAEGEAWPKGRATLFHEFVGHLLERERQRNHPDWPGKEALTTSLALLAEGMQRLGEGTRLSRTEVLERLPARVQTADGPVDATPPALIRLGLAANLLDTELDPSGEQLRFYHHQLQEYFAAVALLDAHQRGEDLTDRWRRARLQVEMPDPGPLRDDEPLPPPPTTGWEEPTIIAAGLAGDPQPLIEAVRMVEPVLAARCLGEPGVASAPGEAERIRDALLSDMANSKIHRRARIAAGDALGQLGDPRFESVEVDGAEVLLPPLVDIPAGESTLGSSRWEVWRLVRQGFPASDERPRHRIRLRAFAIGKFPVTNAEYDCFIADGGYGNECWWDTDQARAWRQGELQGSYVDEWMTAWRTFKADPSEMRRQGVSEYSIAQLNKLLALGEDDVRAMVEKRAADRSMDRPAYWSDERFSGRSQPVVGITWFEARAYCNWLTERWRTAGERAGRRFPEDARVRLPSEVEWECATRAGTGRRFPWGGRWDAGKANTVEGHVLRTTPVGCFPNGATSAGVHDLSGNCWEWCGSLYRDYPISLGDRRDDPGSDGRRVVRGGSRDGGQGGARCAFRFGDRPDDFGDVLGFRVVLSLADPGF